MHAAEPKPSNSTGDHGETLELDILDRHFVVRCEDDETLRCVATAFHEMRGEPEPAVATYEVGPIDGDGGYYIERDGGERFQVPDLDEFVATFNGEITIRSQLLLPELYFVHAAVVESGDRAVLLVAEAGGGKSTTTWALLHHGFGYLSDELAPVNLEAMEVRPFPRALNLKGTPPEPYNLPGAALNTGTSTQVGTADLPGRIVSSALPLSTVFFLVERGQFEEPEVRRMTEAKAAVRLYANALNQLAHPGDGLDAALRIASSVTAFELRASNLAKTCDLVRAVVDKLQRS